MGFERQVKKYHLVFDGEMEGFECKVKGVSMERYLELIKLQDDQALQAVQDMIHALADNLVEWNLEDEGIPVEPTKENVLAEDSDFVMKIFDAWMTALGNVAVPLDEKSTNGSQTPPVSIPMESLSPSLTN